MFHRVLRARSLSFLALIGAASLAAPALAHDSVEFMAGIRAPIPGSVVLGPNSTTPFPSSGISLLGWLPLQDFDSASGSDCWGYTSPSGREYALMTARATMSFVEVTDPGRPVVVASFPAVTSLWRDVKIYQDHAYWVSEGGDGVQVADMSQIDSGVVTYIGGFFDDGTDSSHNIAINEDSGFLYRIGGGGFPYEGLRIYSLANPSAPVFVARWDDRYVHDAQIVSYTTGPLAGREIAFCYSEDESGGVNPGLDIVDVTNKGNIFKISDAFYGSAVFSHQGWLSPDRNTLYLNDELDERSFGTPTTTRIVDVSNINNPNVVGTFTNGSSAVDHNLYTKGNLIYEANYRSGLRIFDATNPLAPVETAFFDTYPENDFAEFNGIWSVFPYFDSGTLIGSDFERGLFTWRLGDPDIDFALSAAPPALLNPAGDSLVVSIGAQGGAAIDAATPTLHVDGGSGFVDVPLVSLGGGDYRADFPAFDCGAEVCWYVSARTTDGVTWSDPPAGPSFVYGAAAANVEMVLVDEDMESNPGWTVGGPNDFAFTGIWERVDPVGTAAQPELDRSDPGTQCWITGQGFPFGGNGDNDVDGGQTTLTTDTIDLSAGDATISYWRWYSNGLGGELFADTFVVEISNNGGGSWVNVETVGPAGDETLGGWFKNSFQVSDLVTPTANVRVRFIAADNDGGSIVEAGVDDFRVTRYDCATCQGDLGFAGPGSALFSVCGEGLDNGQTSTLRLENAAPNALAVLFLGFSNTPTAFKGGTLVPVPVALQLTSSTNGAGVIEFPVPGDSAALTVFAQWGFADGSSPSGVGLSNALQIEFGP